MSEQMVAQTSAVELRALLEQQLLRDSNTPRRAPLSFAQKRLWFLEQMQPNSALYNMQRVARFLGPLEIDALQQALQGVVNRHEPLRTRISVDQGEPFQLISNDVQARLPLEDLSDLTAD